MSPQISSINKNKKANLGAVNHFHKSSVNSTPTFSTPASIPVTTKKSKSFARKILIRTILYPLAFVFFFSIRILFCEIFFIPTSSMEPSLHPLDKILAAKKAYGYSRHSLTPFPSASRFFDESNDRIMYNQPERGDIVAFLSPNNEKYLIKRVIGLPGDVIADMGNYLILNGYRLPRKLSGSYTLKHPINISGIELASAKKYTEQLPSGVQYEIIQIFKNNSLDSAKTYTVPENHLFVIGDNRDNSDDSRKKVGFVPIENLVGRVYIKIYSKDEGMQFKVIN